MKRAIFFLLLLLASATYLRAQLDSIYISGTQIDTSKVYDGTTAAHLVTMGNWPLLPYSQVYISAEAHYLDASVGEDKPVVVTFALSGPDAARYYTPSSIILYADITARRLTADSVQIQPRREYDGTTNCAVLSEGVLHGILPADTVWQTVTAHYANSHVGMFKPIEVLHTLHGPQATNYYVDDTILRMGTITRRNVTPSLPSIKLVKEYDGTDSVQILAQPTLCNAVDGDTVHLTFTAHYDTPEVGDDKTIFTNYGLVGSASNNYLLVSDSLYPQPGRIVPPTVFDTLQDGQQFVATEYGFCADHQASLRYRLRQGEPVSYRIIFSDQTMADLFADTAWKACDTSTNLVTFHIPADCPSGHYSATVQFVSVASVVSSFPITINVNLANRYLVRVFDDVISIDNSGSIDNCPNRFRTFQWYHNGEAIPNATLPYYQAHGNLDGQYSVMVNRGTDDEAMVCPLSFTHVDKATVRLMPSPVTTTTTIKLQGFAEGAHQLRVFNSNGVIVQTATFVGEQHKLDLSPLPQGTYLITVDGHSIRTIKM